jgi:hypothetical protein
MSKRRSTIPLSTPFKQKVTIAICIILNISTHAINCLDLFLGLFVIYFIIYFFKGCRRLIEKFDVNL